MIVDIRKKYQWVVDNSADSSEVTAAQDVVTRLDEALAELAEETPDYDGAAGKLENAINETQKMVEDGYVTSSAGTAHIEIMDTISSEWGK